MLSHKAKYALKALIVLSSEYGKGPVLISEIARREDISQKFLELILLELKNQGILHSKKGKGGGYALAKSPSNVTVGHVLRVIDGPLALLPCVSRTAYQRCDECPDELTCGVRMVMQEVREATAKILDSTTLEDVLRRVELAANGKGSLSFAI